ncbi:PREDICTED: filamentous growth regulator 23-like [Amphimedon queenslandica]|uniref:Uncharacterized protein n=2 Tax=Amphimedon queenslandica TaxID=400682 RepID=A0AAN0JMV5_AMPQE|nr:PREDICTED: filamentous growth regulator 23-like [Amphimedon queenslandica]|eukprot:XP_019858117.1 PREDICTED: filamentous growth regulator 23-like [Amphimedon queenslandica]
MSALSSALSLAVFILLLLVASNEGATGEGVCTEGFMDLSLLVAKAATPVGSLADNTLAEDNEGRWLIAFDTFNFDIRSVYGNRNKYPNIEAWYYDGSSTYQKVLTLPIVLSPDNVTTNGLYRYILPTPISVSGSNRDNYRLGVYQPEDDSSVVRLYNATTSSTERVGRIRADSISESNIRVTGSNREADFQNTNNVFMLRLNTIEYGDILVINVTTNSNPMYYQQYNGPLNYELDSSNGLVLLEHNEYPLISVITKPVPSVTETSSSTVTEDINTVTTMTILSSSTTTTDIIMTPNSILTSTDVIHYSTSLHYTTTLSLLSTTSLFPTNALSTSDTTTNTSALLSSTTGTSASVISSTSAFSSSSSINTITSSHTLSTTESITIPLSSIENSRSTKVSRTQNTVSRGNPTSEVLVTSKKSSSNSISESSVTRSSDPTVLGNTGDDNTVTIIAAVVATVALLIISIIVILILIAIAYKRRSKATLTFGGNDTCLVNTYSDITPNGKEDKELKGPIVYEEAMPVMNGIETVYGDTMIDSTLINVINPTYGAPENGIGASSVYEEPTVAVNKKQEDIEFSNELYGLLEEATLYVPTAKERSGGESEKIYSTLINELYSSTYSRLDHTSGNAFFIEDTEYWEPDSNTDGIYQQLSDRKYIEIIRHQIKVTDYLGSGQFCQ